MTGSIFSGSNSTFNDDISDKTSDEFTYIKEVFTASYEGIQFTDVKQNVNIKESSLIQIRNVYKMY